MRLNRFLCCSGSLLLVGLAACQQDSTPTDPTSGPSVALSKTSSPSYVIGFSAQAGNVKAAIERAGGKLKFVSNRAGLATAMSADPAFADRLKVMPGVKAVAMDTVVQWVEPDRHVRHTGESRAPKALAGSPTNEPFFFFQWGQQAIHAPEAWATSTGSGVKVAVLDGGLNDTHEDLAGGVEPTSASMVEPYAFNFDIDPDGFSHATHVAGIIAARDNDVGTAGVAPDARIIGVKVLHNGSGSFGNIIAGILYAVDDAGADIINMSLGATFPSGRDIKVRALRAFMDDATTYARTHGVLVVASAGNGDKHGRGIDHDLGQKFTLPAQAASVLAVSATAPSGFILGATNFDRITSYTNFGKSLVDLAAPGGDVTLPIVPPDFIGLFDLVLSPGSLPPVNNDYFFAAGTSMAAPMVAGVAALILEEHPTWTPAQVEARLRASAHDSGQPGFDRFYGSGFVDAENAVQ